MNITEIEAKRGNWLQTYTGKMFFPMDPRPEEIDINDIAGALSKACRYGGHCKHFYSVAEHSVLMSQIAKKDDKLAALLHDASEAYLADIPRPVKPYLENYASIENGIMWAISKKFGFAWPLPPSVKELDNNMLADECQQIMEKIPHRWNMGFGKPMGVKVQLWAPEQAEAEFLAQFAKLTNAE